jgi:hypothetical protein
MVKDALLMLYVMEGEGLEEQELIILLGMCCVIVSVIFRFPYSVITPQRIIF